jgi:site-specific recombinase XerD
MSLPPKVHAKSGRYYFVHQNKWHALTRVEEGEPALRRALAEFQNPTPRTLGQLIDAWHVAPHDLAPKTRKEYSAALERLRSVFGKQAIHTINSGHIAQYVTRRGGVKANRELAALSSVYSWAMGQGFAVDNPCHGVRWNKEKPRKRYVSNRELAAAMKATTPAARDLLLAAYFTGLRQGDLRKMTQDQLGREGITLIESKGGKELVVRWSPPLRRLVDRSLKRSRCSRVFTNNSGEPWSLWAVQSFMRRLNVDWNFHDIRAKAESDHKTGMGLLSRYKRARRITPVR